MTGQDLSETDKRARPAEGSSDPINDEGSVAFNSESQSSLRTSAELDPNFDRHSVEGADYVIGSGEVPSATGEAEGGDSAPAVDDDSIVTTRSPDIPVRVGDKRQEDGSAGGGPDGVEVEGCGGAEGGEAGETSGDESVKALQPGPGDQDTKTKIKDILYKRTWESATPFKFLRKQVSRQLGQKLHRHFFRETYEEWKAEFDTNEIHLKFENESPEEEETPQVGPEGHLKMKEDATQVDSGDQLETAQVDPHDQLEKKQEESSPQVNAEDTQGEQVNPEEKITPVEPAQEPQVDLEEKQEESTPQVNPEEKITPVEPAQEPQVDLEHQEEVKQEEPDQVLKDAKLAHALSREQFIAQVELDKRLAQEAEDEELARLYDESTLTADEQKKLIFDREYEAAQETLSGEMKQKYQARVATEWEECRQWGMDLLPNLSGNELAEINVPLVRQFLSLPPDTLVTLEGSAPFQINEMRFLRGTNWLDDLNMVRVLSIIQESAPRTFEFMDPTFFELGTEAIARHVNSVFARVVKLQLDLIMGYIHVGRNHWCCFVVELSKKQILFFDPLQQRKTYAFMKSICKDYFARHLEGDYAKYGQTDFSSFKQTDGYNCGLYVLDFIRNYVQGTLSSFKKGHTLKAERRRTEFLRLRYLSDMFTVCTIKEPKTIKLEGSKKKSRRGGRKRIWGPKGDDKDPVEVSNSTESEDQLDIKEESHKLKQEISEEQGKPKQAESDIEVPTKTTKVRRISDLSDEGTDVAPHTPPSDHKSPSPPSTPSPLLVISQPSTSPPPSPVTLLNVQPYPILGSKKMPILSLVNEMKAFVYKYRSCGVTLPILLRFFSKHLTSGNKAEFIRSFYEVTERVGDRYFLRPPKTEVAPSSASAPPPAKKQKTSHPKSDKGKKRQRPSSAKSDQVKRKRQSSKMTPGGEPSDGDSSGSWDPRKPPPDKGSPGDSTDTDDDVKKKNGVKERLILILKNNPKGIGTAAIHFAMKPILPLVVDKLLSEVGQERSRKWFLKSASGPISPSLKPFPDPNERLTRKIVKDLLRKDPNGTLATTIYQATPHTSRRKVDKVLQDVAELKKRKWFLKPMPPSSPPPSPPPSPPTESPSSDGATPIKSEPDSSGFSPKRTLKRLKQVTAEQVESAQLKKLGPNFHVVQAVTGLKYVEGIPRYQVLWETGTRSWIKKEDFHDFNTFRDQIAGLRRYKASGYKDKKAYVNKHPQDAIILVGTGQVGADGDKGWCAFQAVGIALFHLTGRTLTTDKMIEEFRTEGVRKRKLNKLALKLKSLCGRGVHDRDVVEQFKDVRIKKIQDDDEDLMYGSRWAEVFAFIRMVCGVKYGNNIKLDYKELSRNRFTGNGVGLQALKNMNLEPGIYLCAGFYKAQAIGHCVVLEIQNGQVWVHEDDVIGGVENLDWLYKLAYVRRVKLL